MDNEINGTSYDTQMKEIQEGPVKYIALMGSASHTYGNALAFAQRWLLDLFPKDYFKTIHVSSTIAHKQLVNLGHEQQKKQKPMIAIRPRIARDEDVFLKGTPIIERQGDIYSGHGMTNLQPFFLDAEKKIAIKYQLNRSVMYIDVVLIFQTLMQQINFVSYLENATRLDIPFNIETLFESYVSEDMMNIMSKLSGIPVYDEHGSTKRFLDYMNGKSMFPLTYKIQSSTGTHEFYRLYPVNIDARLSKPDTDDGERIGQVMDSYKVNFSMRMEFNSTGFYYLFSDNIHDIEKPVFRDLNASIIPLYTDVIMKDDLRLHQGWNLYTRFSLKLDNETDSLVFKRNINQSIEQSIKYYMENGLPLIDLIDIKIRRQGKEIEYGRDYTIDFNTLTINFVDPRYQLNTYMVMICVNTLAINELIKTIFNIK